VLEPTDATHLLASSQAPWWIAGGWALDLFRGRRTRRHSDLDVGVLRRDVATLLHVFSRWDVFEAKDGRLTRLGAGCAPSRDVHSLWCRPTAMHHWTIELVLDEADRDTWVYRREPRIRRPMSTVVRENAHGVRYLAPEIQLLYKSKAPRERDEEDFSQICPLLDADAQRWLHDALSIRASVQQVPRQRVRNGKRRSVCRCPAPAAQRAQAVAGTRFREIPALEERHDRGDPESIERSPQPAAEAGHWDNGSD
jgi:aminoglycoside-2''-adenylyltransferase